MRSPASDFGESLSMRPCPLIRSTVPTTSTVAASRSTSSHRTAQASPRRSPVASMKSTRSGRSRSFAFLSWASQARTSRISANSKDRGAFFGLVLILLTSRHGLVTMASCRHATPQMPLSTVFVVLATALPCLAFTAARWRSTRPTVTSRRRTSPRAGRICWSSRSR